MRLVSLPCCMQHLSIWSCLACLFPSTCSFPKKWELWNSQ